MPLLKQLGLVTVDYLYIKASQEDFVIVNNQAKIKKLSGFLGKKIKDKSKLLKSSQEFEDVLKNSKTNYSKNWNV